MSCFCHIVDIGLFCIPAKYWTFSATRMKRCLAERLYLCNQSLGDLQHRLQFQYLLTWLSIEGIHHSLIYQYTCQPRQICIMWRQQQLLNQERGAMTEQHRHLGSSSIGRLRFRETDPSKRRSGATGRQLVATVHHHHHYHRHHHQSVADAVLTTGWWQLIAFIACQSIESLYVRSLFRHFH